MTVGASPQVAQVVSVRLDVRMLPFVCSRVLETIASLLWVELAGVPALAAALTVLAKLGPAQ
jgi:hypothetical protein